MLSQGEAVAVCTMEKANMAINHLLQELRLHEVVAIVVDEVHMLADKHRCCLGGERLGAINVTRTSQTMV